MDWRKEMKYKAKKEKISYAVLLLWIGLLMLGYGSGYFRDMYPNIIIPGYVEITYGISIFVLPLILVFMAIKPKSKTLIKRLLLIEGIIVLILIIFVTQLICAARMSS